MKKTLLSILLALALPGLGDACTNVIVTRGASKDGSVLVSYAADSISRTSPRWPIPTRPSAT